MASQTFSLTEEEARAEINKGKPISLGPKLKKGHRVFTEDGVRTIHRYATDLETQEVTKDVKEVRTEYLDEIHSNLKRNVLEKRAINLGGSYKYRSAGKEERHEGSSLVKHLTEEDIKLEDLQKIRESHWKEYGHMIDENIINLVADYLDAKKRGETSPLKKTHFVECALLGLTKGPANLLELIKRLDTALDGSPKPIKFRFKDVRQTFTETVRRIIKADPEKHWLRRYLSVEGNGEVLSRKYEFPPPMMQIAAQQPDRIKEAWMNKLPKGVLPFTEKQLLKELPILEVMVSTDSLHTGTCKPSKTIQLDDYIRTRRHANDANRPKLYQQIKDCWMAVEDIAKLQLYVGLMASSDCIIGLNKTWLGRILEFMSKHKNKRTYNKFHSGEISASNNKLRAGKLAICSLVLKEGKTTDTSEMGLIPDTASIPFSDLREMCKGRSAEQVTNGFSILENHCRKNEYIDRYVHPEKYEIDESLEEDKSLEGEDNDLNGITRDGVTTLGADTDFLDGLEVAEEEDEEKLSTDTVLAEAALTGAKALSRISKNGISLHFSIGFGRPERKSDPLISELVNSMNHVNEGLTIAIDEMKTIMMAIAQLTADVNEQKK